MVVRINMLPLSSLKQRFKARSPFSLRDDLLGSSSPGAALLLSVSNYWLAHSKRGKKTDWIARLVIGALVGEAGEQASNSCSNEH